jgi:hypothetical protein
MKIMQDRSTGEMKPLDPKFFEQLPKMNPSEFMAAAAGIAALNNAIQEAKDAVQPYRSKQGPVFQVSEVLEIKGGRFQITRIEPGHMRLKGLPSV